VRRNAFVDRICIRTIRESNMNVGILQPEAGIYVRRDFVICFQDVLDVHINKVIEGVNVLLDKAFDFQKGWEQ
jgi:hypothetical protein